MRKTLLVALLASPLVAFAATPELVTNGSFEANLQGASSWNIYPNLTGWTGGTSGIELRNNVEGAATDGVNYVELDTTNNSSLSQVLTTVNGTTYDLSLYYSNRMTTAVATNGLSFDVGAGAVSLPVLGVNNTGGNVWSLFTTQFTATSASTTLTFSAINTSDSYGSSLDKISVTAVPEPETYALMLAGLAAIGFVARRRRATA